MSSYIEGQKAFIRKYKLKVGSKVKVIRSAESRTDGWHNSWVSEMTDTIGKVLTIGSVNENSDSGIYLSEIGCSYPFFVLRPNKLRLG